MFPIKFSPASGETPVPSAIKNKPSESIALRANATASCWKSLKCFRMPSGMIVGSLAGTRCAPALTILPFAPRSVPLEPLPLGVRSLIPSIQFLFPIPFPLSFPLSISFCLILPPTVSKKVVANTSRSKDPGFFLGTGVFCGGFAGGLSLAFLLS